MAEEKEISSKARKKVVRLTDLDNQEIDPGLKELLQSAVREQEFTVEAVRMTEERRAGTYEEDTLQKYRKLAKQEKSLLTQILALTGKPIKTLEDGFNYFQKELNRRDAEISQRDSTIQRIEKEKASLVQDTTTVEDALAERKEDEAVLIAEANKQTNFFVNTLPKIFGASGYGVMHSRHKNVVKAALGKFSENDDYVIEADNGEFAVKILNYRTALALNNLLAGELKNISFVQTKQRDTLERGLDKAAEQLSIETDLSKEYILRVLRKAEEKAEPERIQEVKHFDDVPQTPEELREAYLLAKKEVHGFTERLNAVLAQKNLQAEQIRNIIEEGERKYSELSALLGLKTEDLGSKNPIDSLKIMIESMQRMQKAVEGIYKSKEELLDSKNLLSLHAERTVNILKKNLQTADKTVATLQEKVRELEAKEAVADAASIEELRKENAVLATRLLELESMPKTMSKIMPKHVADLHSRYHAVRKIVHKYIEDNPGLSIDIFGYSMMHGDKNLQDKNAFFNLIGVYYLVLNAVETVVNERFLAPCMLDRMDGLLQEEVLKIRDFAYSDKNALSKILAEADAPDKKRLLERAADPDQEIADSDLLDSHNRIYLQTYVDACREALAENQDLVDAEKLNLAEKYGYTSATKFKQAVKVIAEQEDAEQKEEEFMSRFKKTYKRLDTIHARLESLAKKNDEKIRKRLYADWESVTKRQIERDLRTAERILQTAERLDEAEDLIKTVKKIDGLRSKVQATKRVMEVYDILKDQEKLEKRKRQLVKEYNVMPGIKTVDAFYKWVESKTMQITAMDNTRAAMKDLKARIQNLAGKLPLEEKTLPGLRAYVDSKKLREHASEYAPFTQMTDILGRDCNTPDALIDAVQYERKLFHDYLNAYLSREKRFADIDEALQKKAEGAPRDTAERYKREAEAEKSRVLLDIDAKLNRLLSEIFS